MTKPFPYKYDADLVWTSGREANLDAPPRPTILGTAPVEFNGREDRWDPEHLLLSSLNLCLMLTFVSIAEKARLSFDSYKSRAEGTLDESPEGTRFTSFTVNVTLKVSDADREKAATLLQKAKKYCFISNSVKGPVELKANIVTA